MINNNNNNSNNNSNNLKNNFYSNNNAVSTPSRNFTISPRQPNSPREYHRNYNRNFKAKTRFGGGAAGFLGNKDKKNANYDLDGMNVDETCNGIEVSFDPTTTPSRLPVASKTSTMSPLGNCTSGMLAVAAPAAPAPLPATKGVTTGYVANHTRRLGYRGKFHRTHNRNYNGHSNNNANNNNNNNNGIHKIRRKEKEVHKNDDDHDRDPLVAVHEDTISKPCEEPILSFQDDLRQRHLIYKSQFLTTILDPTKTTSVVSPLLSHSDVNEWRPQGHRIPLCGILPAATEDRFTNVVHLLGSTNVKNERSAVQQELSHLLVEIKALERDRTFLEKIMQTVVVAAPQKEEASAQRNVDYSRSSPTPNLDGAVDWNVNMLLQEDARKKDRLPTSRRMALQRQRGTCLTIHLHDSRVQELLMHKCGGKWHQLQRTRLFKNDDTILTLSPETCRPLGAAVTLQHVALSCSLSSRPSNGFFVSNDMGRGQSGGRIPDQLFRRMKEVDKDKTHKIENLEYLSTGPCDSYYARFNSGDCWWGIPVEDPELQYMLQTWDIYRVAFGSIEYWEEESSPPDHRDDTNSSNDHNKNNDNKVIATTSWIVLAQDGRAAWKNLPTRLSQKLECRLTTRCAPVEVSLGSGGSYFVRFLDGSIEYCLPAKLARVCDRIEKMGGSVTNVCLHPDISQDFIIRHTELNMSPLSWSSSLLSSSSSR
jgi:hypothetical protein